MKSLRNLVKFRRFFMKERVFRQFSLMMSLSYLLIPAKKRLALDSKILELFQSKKQTKFIKLSWWVLEFLNVSNRSFAVWQYLTRKANLKFLIGQLKRDYWNRVQCCRRLSSCHNYIIKSRKTKHNWIVSFSRLCRES